MTEKIFLIGLIVLAIAAVNTSHLRRSIIYLGIFSLISSLVYLFYGAPDVAIAEAVIGSSLTTVLFLVALKNLVFLPFIMPTLISTRLILAKH